MYRFVQTRYEVIVLDWIIIFLLRAMTIVYLDAMVIPRNGANRADVEVIAVKLPPIRAPPCYLFSMSLP